MVRKFVFVTLIVGLLTLLGSGGVFAGHDDGNPAGANLLPHANYRIWDLNTGHVPGDPLTPGPLFGADPNMTVSDPNGTTIHVATAASPFTNVTVMENTFCSGRPCGVTYWNPDTDIFKCYGYSSGAMTGIDINLSAPLITPLVSPATPTNGGDYGPGDTWLFKSSFVAAGSGFGAGDPCGGRCSLTVQFPGTGVFRSWEGGNASSGAVDQSTGLIWLTDQGNFADPGGKVGVFDPATNTLLRWSVGGVPRDIVPVPGTGLAYATVGPTGGVGDFIVEVDRITGAARKWQVPGGGLQSFFGPFSQNPNGIALSAEGHVTFSETISDELATLEPGLDKFIEYLKVDPDDGSNAIREPQNVASSGAGATRQIYFSEAGGGLGDIASVGIVTPVEAAGTVQEVITFVAPDLLGDPEEILLVSVDHEREPSLKEIPPVPVAVDGEDGVFWTDPGPKTPADEVIPGILRFPLPAPYKRAVGMTEVLRPNTVFGSLIGTTCCTTDEYVFEITSGAIIAEPEPEFEGRMTGGGSIPGSLFRHGFELHCDLSPPNNLEINFGNGDRFHLTSLDSARCTDDAGIDEGRPVAGFDTFVGSGVGRLNGVGGISIDFTFTDAGEPGKAVDFADISIDGGDITAAGFLDKGNHQAHPESGGGGVALPDSDWVFNGTGFVPVFATADSTSDTTGLCDAAPPEE